jgi:hypothetical protein
MKITKDWLSGFVDGEGCFYVATIKNSSLTLGYQVQLEFIITQHERDVLVLHAIRDYFGCGLVRRNKGSTDKVWAYRVRDLKSIGEKIIPFFDKDTLLTTKKYNFKKFKQIYLKIAAGEHLTLEGFNEILKIKSLMNRNADCSLLSQSTKDRDQSGL